MKTITRIRKTLGVIGIILLLVGLIGYKFANAQSSPAPAATPTPSSTIATPVDMTSATTTAPATAAATPVDAPLAHDISDSVVGKPASTAVTDPTNDPSGANTGGISDISTADPKNAGRPTALDIANQVGKNKIAINFVWTLLCGFLVMFMQAGFALVETGFTRGKNAAHTMAMNMVIYCLGVLGFYVVGFGLMFGGLNPLGTLGGTTVLNHEFSIQLLGKTFGLFGTTGFFLTGKAYDVAVLTLFLFQVVFMDAAATIPTGAMAERWKFVPFCIWGLFLSMILYPLYGNWVWGGGWLAMLGSNFGLGHGVVDFAGSSVVHAVGGIASLAGVIVLGPRIGKFRKDGTPVAIPGHNLTLALLGVFILAFGWFGFNPGSTLAGVDLRISVVAVNTMLASCAGLFSAMIYMWWKTGKPDPAMAGNGCLAGLVAITAPSAFVNPMGAVIIGLIAGILVILVAGVIEWKFKLDDPVGAIAVHGANGLWGLISVGLFADGTYGDSWNGVKGTVTGLFYGDGGQLVAQLIGVVVCFVFVFFGSLIFFKIVDATIGMRVKPEEELNGIDISEVGVLAYPRDDMFSMPERMAPRPKSS
ncbi:MAG: ammonium transporter [bacterium]